MLGTDPFNYTYGMWVVDTVDDKLAIVPALVKHLVENQHKDIVLSTEHYDLKAVGLYALLDCFTFKSVTIYTWNTLESHPIYRIKQYVSKLYMFYAPRCWGKWNIVHEEWDGSTRFLTLYGRPTKFRLAMASHLNAHHADKSQIYFAANPAMNRQQFDLTGLYEFSADALTEFALLEPKLPLIPPGSFYDNSRWQENDTFLKFYKHSLIDVVIEPNLIGDVFNPTEKVVRPMLMRRPFIVLGPKHILAHLRQMGFKTFGEFWNESYDLVTENQRYVSISALINRIAAMSQTELLDMYARMKPILEHNYNLIITESFSTTITKI